MTVIRAALRVMGILVSLWLVPAYSQEQGKEDIPLSKPTNLQVLPRDMAAAKLGQLMKRFERDLGVSCSYCHVENRDTGKIDYVSDENPKKHTARIMIAMLDDINDRHLAQLADDRRYAEPVTCGNCHQGRASPPAFDGKRR